MIGKPKYKLGQVVSFEVAMRYKDTGIIETLKKEGVIAIVDKYGTFEDNADVSYDILVGDENCLYKHIREDFIIE